MILSKKIISRSPPWLGWLICSLAALFYCYEYLLRIQQSVMIPQLMSYFHASAQQIGVLSSMYYYAYAPLQLVVALLIDYYGSRRMLLFALANCVLGCFIFAGSHTLLQADIGRLFIGFGSAFAFVATLRLASMWLPRSYFTIFIGITSSLGMIGAMFGDVEMSRAVERFGWLFVVYIGLGAGLILMPLFYWFIHDKLDNNIENTPKLGLSYYFSGLLRALYHRQLLMLSVVAGSLYFSLSVFADVWGIPYLQQLTHQSKIHAASINALVYFGWLIGAPLHGILSGYIRDLRWYLSINCLLSAGCFFMVINNLLPLPLLPFILFSFGFFASSGLICFTLAMDYLPQKLIATAIGVLNFFVMLGVLITLPLIGRVLDHNWAGKLQDGVRTYSASNFSHAFYTVFFMLLVAAVISLLLKPNTTTDSFTS